jgi:hypothetical protein
MDARRPFPPLAAAAALLAGCAAEGPFPSLAPRAVERQLANEQPPAPPPIIPSDPATAGRIRDLVAAAREGDGAFRSALAAARPAVGGAGAAGSESWVAAQQAVSRAQAARAPTVNALADLDSLAVRLAAARPAASQADIANAVAAVETVQAIADAQEDALGGLRARLSGR